MQSFAIILKIIAIERPIFFFKDSIALIPGQMTCELKKPIGLTSVDAR